MPNVGAWVKSLFGFGTKAGKQLATHTGEATLSAPGTVKWTTNVAGAAEKTATSTLGKVAKTTVGIGALGTVAIGGPHLVSKYNESVAKAKEDAEDKKNRDKLIAEQMALGKNAEEINKELKAFDAAVEKRKERAVKIRENPSMATWYAIEDFFGDSKKFGVGSVIAGGGAAAATVYLLGDSWLAGPALLVGGLVGQPLLNAITGANAAAPNTPAQSPAPAVSAPAPAKNLSVSIVQPIIDAAAAGITADTNNTSTQPDVVAPKVGQNQPAPAAGAGRAPQ